MRHSDRRGDSISPGFLRFPPLPNCRRRQTSSVREVGRGSNVLGSPLAAIAHLSAVLAKPPQYPSLQANEMVTTGTVTRALSVHAGETWRTELEGITLPGLAVELVG